MVFGAKRGLERGKGVHGVGLAIKQSVVDGMENGEHDSMTRVVECIIARLMKGTLQPTGSNVVTFCGGL